ncbi:MAG: hypothetical protein PVI26_00680 [Chitinispirillia bacterium]|jgi:hypothetical protein
MSIFKNISLYMSYLITFLFIVASGCFFCDRSIDPDANNDQTRNPDFLVVRDTSGVDTLKSVDTLLIGDTLWFYIHTNNLELKDSLTVTFTDDSGNVLFDSSIFLFPDSIKSSRDSIFYLGFYKFPHHETDTFHIKIETDSLYIKKYVIHVFGTAPVIENGGAIFFAGVNIPDSVCTLYIKASNNDTIHYRWYKNGTIQIGKNNDSLFFSPLTVSDTGTYYCIVFNNWGTDTSLGYHLTIGNRPPRWVSDTFHASVYESTQIKILLSDSCLDPENDVLRFTVREGEPSGDTISPSGTYTFTPSFQDAGEYEILIEASDSTMSSFAKLLLTVHNKNRKPVFIDLLPNQSYQINEGELLTISFKAEDPDGDKVSYALGATTIPNPQNIIVSDSQIVWQSGINDHGLYTAEIIAVDSVDTQKVVAKIAVGNVNLPPQLSVNGIFSGDTVKIKEMQTFLCTVSVKDPNIEDTPLFLPVKNAPSPVQYDTLTGIFEYTPPFNVSTGLINNTFSSVTFFASDNVDSNGVDSFVIHIMVLDSNSAPVPSKSSDSITVTEGKNAVYTLTTDLFLDNEKDRINLSSSFGSFNADTTQWTWLTGFSDAGTAVCTLTATDDHIPPASSGLQLYISIADSVVPVTLNNPYDVTYNHINISWSKSMEPQFEAYKIFYDTIPDVSVNSSRSLTVTNISDTTIVLDSLVQNTHYYVKVFTYNKNRSVSASNEVDTTTLFQPPLIFITVPLITRDSCFIKEDDPTVTGSVKSLINIKRITASINGKFIPVSLEGTSWKFSSESSDKAEWNIIKVKAESVIGDTGDTSFYLYQKPNLATPSLPQFDEITNRSIIVSWKSVNYCTNYLVYRSNKGNDGEFNLIKNTIFTSMVDENLDINTEYRYKIQGYYLASGGFNEGDTTEYSDFSTAETKNFFMDTLGFPDRKSIGMSVRQTSDSGYIITGRTGISGNYDVYLIKTDKKGDTLWTRTFGGSKDYNGQSVRQTNDGGYIIVGYSEVSGQAGSDIFLIKTDSEGIKDWENTFRGGIVDKDQSLEQTGDGGYVIVGSTSSYSGGRSDVLLIKTDARGKKAWEETFGEISNDYKGKAIQQTRDRGYIITGSTISGAGGFDVLLIKTDAEGKKVFKKTYGGNEDDEGWSVRQTDDGGYLIVGRTKSYGAGEQDVLLIKTDSDGKEEGKETYGGNRADEGHSVQRTNDGYIVTGSTNSEGAGSSDVFLIKIDKNFRKKWTKTFGGSWSDYGYSVQQTFDRGYIIVGSTKSFIAAEGPYVFLIKTDEEGYSDW